MIGVYQMMASFKALICVKDSILNQNNINLASYCVDTWDIATWIEVSSDEYNILIDVTIW